MPEYDIDNLNLDHKVRIVTNFHEIGIIVALLNVKTTDDILESKLTNGILGSYTQKIFLFTSTGIGQLIQPRHF